MLRYLSIVDNRRAVLARTHPEPYGSGDGEKDHPARLEGRAPGIAIQHNRRMKPATRDVTAATSACHCRCMIVWNSERRKSPASA
jgi:hypothetical protein